MDIKSKEIELRLTSSEAWDLAYHIKNSLEASITSHYCYTGHDSYKRGYEGHAKPLFYEQCKSDLNMMNSLMRCAEGREDFLEDELLDFFKKTYIEKNGNLELNQLPNTNPTTN